MFYINYFNEVSETADQHIFDNLSAAMSFAKENGYSKVRDQKGGEYFV